MSSFYDYSYRFPIVVRSYTNMCDCITILILYIFLNKGFQVDVFFFDTVKLMYFNQSKKVDVFKKEVFLIIHKLTSSSIMHYLGRRI